MQRCGIFAGVTCSEKSSNCLSSLSLIADKCRHLSVDQQLVTFRRRNRCGTYDLKLGLHRISYPAPAEIRPNFHIRPGMRLDMRSDLTIFRCTCFSVQLGRNSLFYEFGNLRLSTSSWTCGSYPHPRLRLYFIAGYIVTLCDVA